MWRKSTYFWLCSRIAGKLWDILLRHSCFLTDVLLLSYEHPVTVQTVLTIILSQLTSSTFRLIWFPTVLERNKEAHRGSFMPRTLLMCCIMMHFKVNDQTYHYKSSQCCCRWNITWITLNKYFLIRLDIDYLSLKSLSLPVRWSRISAMFVVFKHFLCVFVVLIESSSTAQCVVGNISH